MVQACWAGKARSKPAQNKKLHARCQPPASKQAVGRQAWRKMRKSKGRPPHHGASSAAGAAICTLRRCTRSAWPRCPGPPLAERPGKQQRCCRCTYLSLARRCAPPRPAAAAGAAEPRSRPLRLPVDWRRSRQDCSTVNTHSPRSPRTHAALNSEQRAYSSASRMASALDTVKAPPSSRFSTLTLPSSI